MSQVEEPCEIRVPFYMTLLEVGYSRADSNCSGRNPEAFILLKLVDRSHYVPIPISRAAGYNSTVSSEMYSRDASFGMWGLGGVPVGMN